MSNPSVLTLAHVQTNIGKFQIEDNLGEAIHLHIGEIRCDLTVEEFCKLADDVGSALEQFLKISGFEIKKFSAEFLFQLAETNSLPLLSSIEDDSIRLGDICVDTFNRYGFPAMRPLEQSRVIKALNGNPTENNKKNERNYYGETNQKRLDNMLESIKSNGYPYKNQKIVLLKNSNQIYDGQHRAACMYYLWGNIEIPILRISFTDERIGNNRKVIDAIWYFKKATIIQLKKLYNLRTRIPRKIKFIINNLAIKWDRYRFRHEK